MHGLLLSTLSHHKTWKTKGQTKQSDMWLAPPTQQSYVTCALHHPHHPLSHHPMSHHPMSTLHTNINVNLAYQYKNILQRNRIFGTQTNRLKRCTCSALLVPPAGKMKVSAGEVSKREDVRTHKKAHKKTHKKAHKKSAFETSTMRTQRQR